MATVTGTSGAWKAVLQKLRTANVSARSPREVQATLDESVRSHDQSMAALPARVDAELARLTEQTEAQIQKIETHMRNTQADADQQSARWGTEIAQLRAPRSSWQRLINPLRIWRCQRKALRHHQQTQRTIRDSWNRIAHQQHDLQYAIDHRHERIAELGHELAAKIDVLRDIINSTDWTGAEAELRVCSLLAQLPRDYHVYHDVRLTADSFLRFDGEPLMSAQADHIVLTPSGIFVIEVKSWSRSFAGTDNHFNPYTQVARACFLCKVLMQNRGYAGKIRSIIVNHGTLPPKPSNIYTKVLRLQELADYILRFRERPSDHDDITLARDFLECRTAAGDAND